MRERDGAVLSAAGEQHGQADMRGEGGCARDSAIRKGTSVESGGAGEARIYRIQHRLKIIKLRNSLVKQNLTGYLPLNFSDIVVSGVVSGVNKESFMKNIFSFLMYTAIDTCTILFITLTVTEKVCCFHSNIASS